MPKTLAWGRWLDLAIRFVQTPALQAWVTSPGHLRLCGSEKKHCFYAFGAGFGALWPKLYFIHDPPSSFSFCAILAVCTISSYILPTSIPMFDCLAGQGLLHSTLVLFTDWIP